jgi:hypothetical protein
MMVPIPVTFTTKRKIIGYSTGKCSHCGQTEAIRTDSFRTLEYYLVVPYYSHGWSENSFCDFCENLFEGDSSPKIKGQKWSPNENEIVPVHKKLNPQTPIGPRDPNNESRLNAMLESIERQCLADTPKEIPLAMDSKSYRRFKNRVHQTTFTNYFLVLLPMLVIGFFAGILVSSLLPRHLRERMTTFWFIAVFLLPIAIGAVFYFLRRRSLLFGRLLDKCSRYQINMAKLEKVANAHPARIQKAVSKVAQKLTNQPTPSFAGSLTPGKRPESVLLQWLIASAIGAPVAVAIAYMLGWPS